MDREEAIKLLICEKACVEDVDGNIGGERVRQAYDMAIESLSADAVQGVGRYENAMQKLRDMPKYLNGVKEKQITKTSANYTTKKPNDEVEQGNDVVVEPTDLISRADAVNEIHKYFVEEIDKTPTEIDEDGDELYADMPTVNSLFACNKELSKRIKALPSADRPAKLLKDGTLKVNTQNGAEVNRVLVWGDDRCGGLYYADDRPSGEWIPCSERLPEDGQAVIICTDDKRFKNHPVGTCTYEHGRFHTNFHDDISMIAWMPLPKPYCPNCGAKMGGK